jgi:hypothetical protein
MRFLVRPSLVHGIREGPWHVVLDRDPAVHPRERMPEIDLAITLRGGAATSAVSCPSSSPSPSLLRGHSP